MNAKSIILIVDSDQTSTLLLKEVLLMVLPNAYDYQILSAPHGKEAINLCRRKKPEMVFTEIRLKDIDGYQVTKEIKASNPDILVIIQTATVSDYFKQTAFEAGCDGFISKPLDINELDTLLRTLLRTSS
ncbi:MAG: response regulator [Bacteroidales bacterium]